jgi:transcriptional regulator of acetoin/glycerol metabolism
MTVLEQLEADAKKCFTNLPGPAAYWGREMLDILGAAVRRIGELEMERAHAAARAEAAEAANLGPRLPVEPSPGLSRIETMQQAITRAALGAAGGVVVHAARWLGVSRGAMNRRVEQLRRVPEP